MRRGRARRPRALANGSGALFGRVGAVMLLKSARRPAEIIVDDLDVGQRQQLEVLSALFRGADTLILDEPTAVLAPHEASALFDVMRRMRDTGSTLVLITHKLDEVLAVADVVTVMRSGRVVATHDLRTTQVLDSLNEVLGSHIFPEKEDGSDPRGCPSCGAVPARGARFILNHESPIPGCGRSENHHVRDIFHNTTV